MRYTYQYLEDEWNSSRVSYKPITWEIIENNQDEDWNWDSISQQPTITWDIIQHSSDKEWNWDSISGNSMKKDKENWINNLRLQIIKALQIQRHWRNCTSNPEYKLAQKLLQETFDTN